MRNLQRASILFYALLFASTIQAQNEATSIDSLKAEIKREVKQELKAEIEVEKPKKLSFKPYGFVRNFICYDSRQNLHAMGDTFNIIPLDELLNEDSTQDLNKTSELTFVAFTTRLGLDIGTSNIGKMAASAKIEADFCGYGTNLT